MKQALLEAPILVIIDLFKQFVIETNASRVAVGAVSLHEEYLLSFFGKRLPLHLKKASTYVRKLYAITEAI